jgi:hypothetical protein
MPRRGMNRCGTFLFNRVPTSYAYATTPSPSKSGTYIPVRFSAGTKHERIPLGVKWRGRGRRRKFAAYIPMVPSTFVTSEVNSSGIWFEEGVKLQRTLFT